MNQIVLNPCPFCEGPACPFVGSLDANGGYLSPDKINREEGTWARAHVFCHECGAEGPSVEEFVFDEGGYFELEGAGVSAWQERTAKHRELYDAGVSDGLNLYPRNELLLWCIRIPGPDDLYAMTDKATAEAEARKHDAAIRKFYADRKLENDPFAPALENMLAVVEVWPWSAASHAESLLERAGAKMAQSSTATRAGTGAQD